MVDYLFLNEHDDQIGYGRADTEAAAGHDATLDLLASGYRFADVAAVCINGITRPYS